MIGAFLNQYQIIAAVDAGGIAEHAMPHDVSLIATVAIGFALAFPLGYIAQRLRLPPLVGYLMAGVAMGLIREGTKYAILTAILGTEDHRGDMDFMVAGTENGITSIQMDIKIEGRDLSIMEEALAQARDGRLHLLNEMTKALAVASGSSR